MSAQREKVRVAILYATRGGMGGVGKLAAVQALSDPRITATVIAVAHESEGSSLGLTDSGTSGHDVADPEARAEVARVLGAHAANVIKVNIGADDAADTLASALAGTDAVVACMGNRQATNTLLGAVGLPTRWCSIGARKLLEAMRNLEDSGSPKRLVMLSSMGIGNDFLPFSVVKAFWWLLLHTSHWNVMTDLVEMEAAVAAAPAAVDYALVRAMGLTPIKPYKGAVHVLRSSADAATTPLGMTVDQADVARFMLDEVLSATVHRAAVTVGHPPQ
jgi:hypothetical protein